MGSVLKSCKVTVSSYKFGAVENFETLNCVLVFFLFKDAQHSLKEIALFGVGIRRAFFQRISVMDLIQYTNPGALLIL